MIGFKYLGATCSAEVCIRIASAMAILNRIWRCNTISFACTLQFYKSLVTFILLDSCEKKDAGFRNQVSEETFPHLLLGAQDHPPGCGARSTSLLVHRNLLRLMSRDGNLHGSGKSRATTASPKPFFRAPWRVGDAVVGRGKA